MPFRRKPLDEGETWQNFGIHHVRVEDGPGHGLIVESLQINTHILLWNVMRLGAGTSELGGGRELGDYGHTLTHVEWTTSER